MRRVLFVSAMMMAMACQAQDTSGFAPGQGDPAQPPDPTSGTVNPVACPNGKTSGACIPTIHRDLGYDSTSHSYNVTVPIVPAGKATPIEITAPHS